MKLTVHTFTSLDGVMQGPGGADEDPSGGFSAGGWMVPFVDDPDFDEIVDGWFADCDELLLGRTTYDMMHAFWSTVTDPDDAVAAMLNGRPKHVVSRTLDTVDWQHATLLDGDLGDAVGALKARDGGELQVHGSWRLVQDLQRLGLVDEYRLLVFPVVVGEGKRLFPDGSPATTFDVVASRVTSRGATYSVLRPTGPLAHGEIVVEDGAEAIVLPDA